MSSPLQPPEIPAAERIVPVMRSPVMRSPVARSAETIQPLRDEIAVLKGERPLVCVGLFPASYEALARS